MTPIYYCCLQSIYTEACRVKSQLLLSLTLVKFRNTSSVLLQVKRDLLAAGGDLQKKPEGKLLLCPNPSSGAIPGKQPIPLHSLPIVLTPS